MYVCMDVWMHGCMYDNPQLRRINLPLHLYESQFPREFQVVQNLAYDVIRGRNFLQCNRAIIYLDNNTITVTKTENPRNQESSTSVPTMGTFTPREKNFEAREHAFTS